MLKIWAFIYRVTGWYSPFAKVAEYNHIRMKFSDIVKKHSKQRGKNKLNLDMFIHLEVRMWQAQNGFYRNWF